MITRINLIRNVTQFDSVQPAREVDFKRLTLVYAENGRGKTSLSAILRSLFSGDPIPIQERSRLGAAHQPHIVIQSDAPIAQFLFQNNAWNHSYPLLSVFDDIFVVENVYSGLEVQANHRQSLHEFILGSHGVDLARRVDELTTEIANLNIQIQQTATEIPTTLRGHLSVDQFCDLVAHLQIDQEIEEIERQIVALSHAPEIASTAIFQPFSLPAIDLGGIQTILSSSLGNIDQTSLSRVTEHFARIGTHGEQWVADGINREILPAGEATSSSCPYCAQNLSDSIIVSHYRSYFSQEYANFKRTITDSQSSLSSALSGDSLASFLRQVQDIQNKTRFWAQFCQVPEFNVDLQVVQTLWQSVRETLVSTLEIKRASPLEILELTQEVLNIVAQYEQLTAKVSELSNQFQITNNDVQQIKRNISQTNLAALNTQLAILRITQTRFRPDVIQLCDTYMQIKQEKGRVEELKTEARVALDEHRATAFPNFQTAINNYLQRFNAGFEIVNVQPVQCCWTPEFYLSNSHQ